MCWLWTGVRFLECILKNHNLFCFGRRSKGRYQLLKSNVENQRCLWIEQDGGGYKNFWLFEMFVEPNCEHIFLGYFMLLLLLLLLPLLSRNCLSQCVTVNHCCLHLLWKGLTSNDVSEIFVNKLEEEMKVDIKFLWDDIKK